MEFVSRRAVLELVHRGWMEPRLAGARPICRCSTAALSSASVIVQLLQQDLGPGVQKLSSSIRRLDHTGRAFSNFRSIEPNLFLLASDRRPYFSPLTITSSTHKSA